MIMIKSGKKKKPATDKHSLKKNASFPFIEMLDKDWKIQEKQNEKNIVNYYNLLCAHLPVGTT